MLFIAKSKLSQYNWSRKYFVSLTFILRLGLKLIFEVVSEVITVSGKEGVGLISIENLFRIFGVFTNQHF